MSDETKETGFFNKANEVLPFSRLLLKAGEKFPLLKKIAPYANLAFIIILVILILLIAIPSSSKKSDAKDSSVISSSDSSSKNEKASSSKSKGKKSKDGITGNSYSNSMFGTIEFKKDGKFYCTSTVIDIESGTYSIDKENESGPMVFLHGKDSKGTTSASVLRINNNGKSLSFLLLGMEVAEFTKD